MANKTLAAEVTHHIVTQMEAIKVEDTTDCTRVPAAVRKRVASALQAERRALHTPEESAPNAQNDRLEQLREQAKARHEAERAAAAAARAAERARPEPASSAGEESYMQRLKMAMLYNAGGGSESESATSRPPKPAPAPAHARRQTRSTTSEYRARSSGRGVSRVHNPVFSLPPLIDHI